MLLEIEQIVPFKLIWTNDEPYGFADWCEPHGKHYLRACDGKGIHEIPANARNGAATQSAVVILQVALNRSSFPQTGLARRYLRKIQCTAQLKQLTEIILFPTPPVAEASQFLFPKESGESVGYTSK